MISESDLDSLVYEYMRHKFKDSAILKLKVKHKIKDPPNYLPKLEDIYKNWIKSGTKRWNNLYSTSDKENKTSNTRPTLIKGTQSVKASNAERLLEELKLKGVRSSGHTRAMSESFINSNCY